MRLNSQHFFRQPAGFPAGFFVCIAAALLGCAVASAAPPSEISFLHLRLSDGKVQVLSHQARPGTLKSELSGSDRAAGTFQWEIESRTGELLRFGEIPIESRVEYPSADGGIGSAEVVPAFEWVVRTPAVWDAALLRLYRTAPGLGRQAARRELVGAAEVPAPSNLLQAQSAITSKLVTLLTNGPSSNRLNAVILAEGFRASEEASFLSNAVTVLEKLLHTPPYSSLRAHFNGFAIFVPSNESGADHPSQNIFKDTYFNSSYESSGIDRLLTIPPNSFNSNFADGRGRAFSLLQKHVPDYDLVMMLVNDPAYGGSGGTPALASLSPSSADIIIHELGHSYAGLGDEYDSAASFPDTEEPNTTRETRRDFIKWNLWIEAATPVPTPETALYSRVVGLFEGAHYHATGWYRPKLDCAMRSLGAPFCEVCSEALIVASYGRIDMLDSVAPPPGPVSSTRASPAQLSFQAVPGMGESVQFTWTANGSPLPGVDGGPLDFRSVYATAGSHAIELTVRDTTDAVRNDPFQRLVETKKWTVAVVSSDPPVVTGSAAGQGGPSSLKFVSTHLATLILEASTDLTAWTTIQTNAASFSLEQPVPPSGAGFFRVRAHPAF